MVNMRIYTKLGLVEQSNDYFDKALHYAGNIKDQTSRRFVYCIFIYGKGLIISIRKIHYERLKKAD